MSIAIRVAAFNRLRKWKKFQRRFEIGAATLVLDIGCNDLDYSPTANFIEKHYPYPDRITAISLEVTPAFSGRYPRVKSVRGDGLQLPFRDQQFDICWSNAVVEHVGSSQQQVAFFREVRRVAKRGFITTPNRMFPVEVHTQTPFLHYLPKRWFDRYLRWVGKEWATGSYMSLLSLRDLKRILGEAGFTRYSILKNRIGPFVVDFVVVF